MSPRKVERPVRFTLWILTTTMIVVIIQSIFLASSHQLARRAARRPFGGCRCRAVLAAAGGCATHHPAHDISYIQRMHGSSS